MAALYLFPESGPMTATLTNPCVRDVSPDCDVTDADNWIDLETLYWLVNVSMPRTIESTLHGIQDPTTSPERRQWLERDFERLLARSTKLRGMISWIEIERIYLEGERDDQ